MGRAYPSAADYRAGVGSVLHLGRNTEIVTKFSASQKSGRLMHAPISVLVLVLVILQINQRLYLLSQLKSQGMKVQALHELFIGLIMSKITYALPVFAGHLTADDRNRMNAISRKAPRRGVTHTAFDIAEIINKFDRKLFPQIIHPGHCLQHLLPPKAPAHCRYSLRERQHSFQLSNIELLYSVINRCLFKFR